MSLEVKGRAGSLEAVRQYQSEVAAIRESPEPLSARLTMHTLTAMVLAAIAALFIATTDKVITSIDGKMITKEPETVVQALDPSIIKTIEVKEGDLVKKGQVLATLDPTFAVSAVDQLRTQIDGLIAEIARDKAEIAFQPLVYPASDDPDFAHYAKLQRDYFDQQMAQYNAQLNSFDQKIELAKATIIKYKEDGARYEDRVKIESQVEGMYTTLEQHGSGSLLNQLTSSDTRLDTARNMEFDRNSVIESEHSLSSLQADRAAAVQQFLATASADLATSQTALDGARAQLDAAMKHKDLVKITAAEDSIVLSVAHLSIGSVLKQGDALLTLTPTRVPVIAEIKISPRDVGFVRPGDSVSLKIDAFNYAEHGMARGTVIWIGEDINDPNAPSPTQNGAAPQNVGISVDSAGQPLNGFYKAWVSIDSVKLIGVPNGFRLVPGMTLTADIKVGTRSLFQYVMGSLIRGAGDSMREP